MDLFMTRLFWKKEHLKRKSAWTSITLTSAAASTLAGLAWQGRRGGQRYVWVYLLMDNKCMLPYFNHLGTDGMLFGCLYHS